MEPRQPPVRDPPEIGQDVRSRCSTSTATASGSPWASSRRSPTPWQQVLDAYHVDDVVEGRVTKVVTFGAFVEILPGVEGLVHISSWRSTTSRTRARSSRRATRSTSSSSGSTPSAAASRSR